MALRSSSSAGLSTEAILKLLQPLAQPEQKASALERIFAPLVGIGSIPDAIYRGAYNNENPLAAYGGNVVEGLKTAFTGSKQKKKKIILHSVNQQNLLTENQYFKGLFT